MVKKDNIFEAKQACQDFQFTEKVAEVFDDMLDRSIPCYRQLINMTSMILTDFLQEGDLLYDLGCSTGTTLLTLSSKLRSHKLHYIGIDNSQAMLNKANLKAEMYSKQECLQFINGNILQEKLNPAGAIICNYTLQFIRPIERLELLKKIRAALKPGGVFLLSEKIITDSPPLNRAFIHQYLEFKRGQGYSEIEISQKREALENILVPFSNEENLSLLRQAGFSAVEPFFRWFNFCSYLAIK